MSTALPRVLVVEDDPSIRGFVALALEDLALELVECPDVDAALAALAQGPAALVITDLMLPGPSGLSLVERLVADPALRGGARIAVFSAGLSASVRESLEDLGVRRLLHKPVSVTELQACALEALGGPASADAPAPAAVPVRPDADLAGVIARHFGGDATLYAQFRASCCERFGADVEAGDAACARGDGTALRHQMHSLKTVLLMLGHEALSELARRGEGAAGDLAGACAAWRELRSELLRLAA